MTWLEWVILVVVLAVIARGLRVMDELSGPPEFRSPRSHGVIWRRRKQDGDQVSASDIIADSHGNALYIEIKAGFNGILQWIEKEGSPIPLGKAIAVVENGGKSYRVIVSKKAFDHVRRAA